MVSEQELKPSQQARNPVGLRIHWIVLLIAFPFLLEALLFLTILFRKIALHNDTSAMEGAGIYAFLNTFRTGRLYSDPYQFPYNLQMYGPVFYLVGAIVAKFANGDAMLTTELARCVSLGSFLGSVGLMGYLSWRLERNRLWTLAAVVIGLACPWAIPTDGSARADALAIFFVVASLTMYVLAEGRGRLIFLAGMLASLGILTKQSVAAVPLALILDSLLAKRFRTASLLTIGGLSITAPLLFFLWFRHEPFLANFTMPGHLILDWPSVFPILNSLMHIFSTNFVVILIALIGLGTCWREERYRLFLLAIGLAWITNVAALANSGGAGNYLQLPWLLLLALVPAGFCWIERSSRTSLFLAAGLILFGLLPMVQERHVLVGLSKNMPHLATDSVAHLRLLTDSSYLEMRSAEPELLDAFFYHQLAKQKLWSMAPILTKINEGKYDLILLSGRPGTSDSEFWVRGSRGNSLWGADTLAVMMTHYRVLCKNQEYLALIPRDREDIVTGTLLEHVFGQPCEATDRMPRVDPALN